MSDGQEAPQEPCCLCERCGRLIPLSASSEPGHGTAYLAEYFYCADRAACAAAVAATQRGPSSP